MTYLLSAFWAWLLLTLVGGIIVGWATWGASDRSRFGGWLPYGALVFVIALTVTLLQLLSDAAALWLETALLFCTAYLVGCCFGSLVRTQQKVEAVAQAVPTVASAPSIEVTQIALPAARVAATFEEPAASPPVAGEEKHAGQRPKGLVSPRGGAADDLKLIRGIGPQNENRLHALGVWHFAQIAAWTVDEVSWVGSYLAFPGRIEREDWRGQAQQLATRRQNKFAAGAGRGEIATRREDNSKKQSNIAGNKSPKASRKKN